MRWEKRGLIFQPAGRFDWVQTHAWVPTPEALGDGYFRVYFAGRNSNNFSQVGAFTIHIEEPEKILDLSPEPVVALGPLGTFDDSGVVPSCVLNHEGRKYLYYVGRMQGKRVPYYASVGTAVSEDDGKTFRKLSLAPLLGRNDMDPLFTATACVRVENGHWRMWYTSNTAWRLTDGQPLPRYHIKYATSTDGLTWERQGIVAIDFMSHDEYAISRPWVTCDDGLYKMWYSYRGKAYRIGYAESADGVTWSRMDEHVGIDVSKDGWDSEMIEYGAVVEHDGRKYMLYNGNNYGYDGIGLAVEV